MKLNIREMLNGYVENDIEIRGNNVVSADKIKEVTMDKIIETNKKRIFKPGAVVAAVCILALLLGTTAMAYFLKWGGFALLGGLSDEEITQLMEQASTGAAVSIDTDGNCTYYDADGNVLFVLTEKENKEFEARLQAEHEEAVRNSTTILDVDTLELLPNSVTELSVSGDGAIPDFMLGNGHLILMKNNDNSGWKLKAGDRITLQLASNDECYMAFGMIKDTVMLEENTVQSDTPTWSFIAPEDGEYYFSVEYFSVSASSFTNGTITVQDAS